MSPFRLPALALAMVLLLGAPAELPADAGARSTTPGLASAINQAGRQRMLSQRVVKLHAQIGMDVAAPMARRLLDESLTLFAAQLAQIEPYAKTPASRAALVRLQDNWPRLRALALARPSKEGALRLHAASEEVLAAADALTVALEDGSALGALVNVSGRQRMVSQRLAKLYMLRAWEVAVPNLSAQIGSAEAEFTEALGRLLRAGENSAEIDRELYAIAVQWEWFRSALGFQGVASYALVVADASENMLRSLERVVGLYQEAAGR